MHKENGALRAEVVELRRASHQLREALQEILSKKSLAAPSLWRIAEGALRAGAVGPAEEPGKYERFND